MRSITDVLLAASLVLVLPAAAQARNGGSHHTTHSDLTITKTSDKASNTLMKSSQKTAKKKLPGKRKPPTLTLKRGKNQE